MSLFFSDFQETHAHEDQKNHRQSDRTEWAYSIIARFDLAYARINRSGVNFVFYPEYFLNYTSSQFAPTSPFASATATNIVRYHQLSMLPPWFRWACKIIWTRCPPTSERGQYNDDNVPCRWKPIHQPPLLQGCIRHCNPSPLTKTPPHNFGNNFSGIDSEWN